MRDGGHRPESGLKPRTPRFRTNPFFWWLGFWGWATRCPTSAPSRGRTGCGTRPESGLKPRTPRFRTNPFFWRLGFWGWATRCPASGPSRGRTGCGTRPESGLKPRTPRFRTNPFCWVLGCGGGDPRTAGPSPAARGVGPITRARQAGSGFRGGCICQRTGKQVYISRVEMSRFTKAIARGQDKRAAPYGTAPM
jgi:hypothetical protein